MKKKLSSILGILCVIVFGLSGCGSEKHIAKMDAYTEEVASDTYGFNVENNTMEYDQGEPAEATTTATIADDRTGEVNNETKSGNEYEQKLIRTVYLDVETEYFDDSVLEIDELCKKVNGYIGSSDLSNYSYDRRYSVELRIPVEHLDQFLDYLTSMGRMKIRNKTENTQDITLDYFDSYEHKKSLETERDRILELIEEADSLEYVVQLEDKLSELRYQISSYESALRRMDDKVTYSTVTLDIREVRQVTVEEDASLGERMFSGLKQNLIDIKDSLGDFSVWFVTYIPQIAIFAIIIFILIKVLHKRGKKSAELQAKAQDIRKEQEKAEQK